MYNLGLHKSPSHNSVGTELLGQYHYPLVFACFFPILPPQKGWGKGTDLVWSNTAILMPLTCLWKSLERSLATSKSAESQWPKPLLSFSMLSPCKISYFPERWEPKAPLQYCCHQELVSQQAREARAGFHLCCKGAKSQSELSSLAKSFVR